MRTLKEIAELEPSEALVATVGEAVAYARVEIGPDGAAEVDERGRVVFVPRDRISRIVLRKGISAERPLLQALFGFLCFGVAALAWVIIAEWSANGGTLFVETASGFAMIPLGIGIFWALLRPRFFLRVETRSDARHLIFRGRVQPAELRRFLAQVETTQALSIEREVPGFDRSTPYRDS